MTRLYLSLILALAILALAGFVFWRYFYLDVLVLDIIPTEATVTVNGTPVADRTLHLKQGSYQLVISAPGYRSQSFSYSARLGGHTTKRVELVSLPKPQKVIDSAMHSLRTNADHSILYFAQDDTLYRLNLTEAGQPAEPITPKLNGIRRVDWAPDFSLAILYRQNGEVGVYDFNRYDLLNQSYKAMTQPVTDTAWDVSGTSFYYLTKLPDGISLLVQADRSGNDLVRYDHLGIPANRKVRLVQGPTNEVMITGADPAVPDDIISSNNHTRTVIPITTSQNAYDPVFSDDKKQLAFRENGELVMATHEGKDRRNTNIRPNGETYAFGPSKLFVLTPNQLSAVDRTTGALTTLDVYAPDDTITSLFVSTDEKTVYYLYQGTLFSLPVNQ